MASRPATNPPASALPPIPTARPKTNLPSPASPDSSTVPSASQLASKLRSPPGPPPRRSSQNNSPSRPSPLNAANGAVAARRIPSLSGSEDKSLRRTVSVSAFPQPPRPGSRPSLSHNASLAHPPSPASRSPERKPAGSLRSKKTSGPSGLPNSRPGLLENAADGKSIAGPDAEGRWSIPVSPTLSGSSSAPGLESAGVAGDTAAGSSSKRSSRAKESKGNVIVSVRVRPDAAGADHTSEGEWLVDGRRALVSYRGKEGGDYYYDNVFTAHDNNAKVYDACAKRLVRRVMEGYHGTMFAYGMTGTGKTFSMQGTATSPGVIPLAITDIFSYIRETPHREFLLRVSYLEIYNEKIHDLLSAPVGGAATGPNAPPQDEIKLREDSKRGVYATPLKEEIVQSPTQLLRVIARGDHARRTGSTQFNARSSRSHAVVQIVVESRERISGSSGSQEKRAGMVVPGGVRVSTLSLIDLAGSERAADDKERRAEGAHINKSLLTLGTVIARLSEKHKEGEGKHLPYRDSKLTRLLQPALSGNSLVSILCTIQLGPGGSAAPASTHINETLNTLKFAARAKNNIVSHAKRAEESLGPGGDAGSRALLERYRMEIQSLRAQLEEQTRKHAEHENKLEEHRLEQEAAARHEEQVMEMQLARTALKERIEHLNRLILCSKSMGVNAGAMSLMAAFPGGPRSADTRSLRSIASFSTLAGSSSVGAGGAGGTLTRSASLASMRSGRSARSSQTASQVPLHAAPFAHADDEEETMGEFGDGLASLQMQVTALQADLADKNRYISTLERRLLQARRSSHSRMSMGISQLRSGGAGGGSGGHNPAFDDPDVQAALREKDMEIADLRMQLDDKDRMLSALRSAARQRDVASRAGHHSPTTSPLFPAVDPLTRPATVSHHQSTGSNSSSVTSGSASNRDSNSNTNTNSATSTTRSTGGTALMSPVKFSPAGDGAHGDGDKDKPRPDSATAKPKRRSVDEVSRMLDEMIQDRVESGHIIRGPRGSMRVASMALRRDERDGLQQLPEHQDEQQYPPQLPPAGPPPTPPPPPPSQPQNGTVQA
ncbi:hypothetical protein VTO42DRAFT_1959 [Malbranchea cinnamomea]